MDHNLNCYFKNSNWKLESIPAFISLKIWGRFDCHPHPHGSSGSVHYDFLPARHLWEEIFCAKANNTTRKSMFFILDVEYLFVSLNEQQSLIKDCLELYPKLSILLWFYLFIIKHKHKICIRHFRKKILLLNGQYCRINALECGL